MSNNKRKLVMKIGLMWYEKDADDVYAMIAAAAAYYFAKFGTVPKFCHVHPVMFKADQKIVKRTGSNMQIVLDKSIRPNHAWVGIIS